jgi:hypothetical protein
LTDRIREASKTSARQLRGKANGLDRGAHRLLHPALKCILLSRTAVY